MSSQNFYFLGTAKWCKVKEPDDKFNKTGTDLYMTEGSWKAFNSSGIQIKVRENDEGQFVRFSRPWEKLMKGEVVHLGPPIVLIRREEAVKHGLEGESSPELDYIPFTGLVGNGSFVSCKVNVYDTKRGKGHQLEVVAVETLVPYESKNMDADTGELMPF
jgi:hypothetical protein